MPLEWNYKVNLLLNGLIWIIVGYFYSLSLALAKSVIKNYCTIKNETFT